MNTALTIAGSDSSGGAGIQADLKTFSVLGVFGMSAITAVTAQNTLGVIDVVELSPRIVAQQIDAVAADIPVDAVKTGMLGSEAIIEVVEEALRRNALGPYVCDPVMVAKSGAVLLRTQAVQAMVRRLFPLATVVTPNRREAAALIGVEATQVATIADAQSAARRIGGLGARAVVVKGILKDGQMLDVFFDGSDFVELAEPAQPAGKTHGSGCTFSAAITAGLADGLSLPEAIRQAKRLVTIAIRYSGGQGRGTAPVNVLAFAPKKE